MIGASLFCLGRTRAENSEFLIQSWHDHEGLPESSALDVAQTPDGYIWVGSNEGLLRFNGVNFVRAEKFTDLTRLSGVVSFLQVDRSGRLWANGEGRLAVYDGKSWQGFIGTNIAARSVAEDTNGQMVIGGTAGELYTIVNGKVVTLAPPEGLKPSGVFCITDAKDGQLWLANRGFIGRRTASGWTRFAPAEAVPRATIAAPAPAGGLWVYRPGELKRFQADGTVKTFSAPDLDQPREMLEDRDGIIWIVTISRGVVYFRPDGKASLINTTNGLTHNAIRCVMQDKEGNYWVGGSLNGLDRLKPRQFITIGREDGLPENVVRSITEVAPGETVVGTHGGGIASIHNGKAVAEPPPPRGTTQGRYIWSVLHDRTGRLWIGTFNDGLFVEENGVRREFPLPEVFANTVAELLEDTQGRIWVGGPGGLGFIEGNAMTVCFTNSPFSGFSITALAEDTKASAFWIGTYAHGIFRLNSTNFSDVTALPSLPANRISSLTVDDEGYVWIGIFEHGLACFHDGKTTLIGTAQGLPGGTVGALLDDGQGSFWLGTTHGILRVPRSELHRLAQSSSPPAIFNLFNVSDGLGSEYCTEGYQPNALRDTSGHLWFTTDRGVVTVDPARVRINTNTPHVSIESADYVSHVGNHVEMPPRAGQMVIPAGATELEFHFDGLSYTAPEKVNFKYQLEGADEKWVNLGNDHELRFRSLAPGRYVLHLAAANNDGIWNEAGAALPFVMQPFIWQTLWFRFLALLAVAGGGGLMVWRAMHRKFQRRIEKLQSERRLEQERAQREKYFRWLIEHASDSITVINATGVITFQSSSGERILGGPAEMVLHQNLFELVHPEDLPKTQASIAQALAQLNVPVTLTARLRHHDGSWRTVQTVGTATQTESGEKQIVLNSRDITDHLKLEAQLRQAQKMEAVGQLAGGVAHDFNNILTSLRLQAELLWMTDNLPERLREGLQQICADADRATVLTRQLLQYSRRQVMQSRVLDLNLVVQSVSKMLQRLIREDVQLDLKLWPTPLMTQADAGMLDQVLMNLAVNARDAMTGGGRLRIETSQKTVDVNEAHANPEATPGRYVCFSVNDTGGGIAPEILPRIFEPFFTTKEAGKGTGLGLATVFGIVKQHGGWIKLDNQPGVGVTFHILLPASTASVAEPVKVAAKPKPRGGTETILLVEDEPAVRKTTKLILERHGYKVLEAPDGQEALKVWAENKTVIALLLTDLVMPGELGGRDLGRQLVLERPGLKVIYASGYSADIAGRDFQLQSGHAFIQKPFETEQLMGAIRRCLDM